MEEMKLTLNQTETREITADFEVRSEGSQTIIEGYAAVFNKRSSNLGGFFEQITPGAFKKTLQESDVRALWNHDANFPLGRMSAGTLRAAEDDNGLHYEITLGSQSYARDLAISMERGDVSQSSFQFRAIKDDWGFTEEDFPLRTLAEVALYEVSPVTFPAYPDATSSVGKRALERLAATKHVDLSVVEQNLSAVIRDEIEPVAKTITQVRHVVPVFEDDSDVWMQILNIN